MSLTDATVRHWAGQEEFLFWMEGGGQQSRDLTGIVWVAAALGADEQETQVFFARNRESYREEDWASGTVAELRAAVVELIMLTLGRATVEGTRRGAWAEVGDLVECWGCEARVAAVGSGAEHMDFYCPTCWNAWVEGAGVLRQAPLISSVHENGLATPSTKVYVSSPSVCSYTSSAYLGGEGGGG